MRFEDALFYWLQIKLVVNARPDDDAAHQTVAFFEQVLQEDHGLSSFAIAEMDDTLILVQYTKDGASMQQRFPREAGEQLLRDIAANPKYN